MANSTGTTQKRSEVITGMFKDRESAERVHVERHPVDRPVTDADAAFREDTLEITERAEEAVVSKTARVVEEVVVGKQVEEHTEVIRDTVRRTDVDVQEVNSKDSIRTDRDR